MITMRLNQPKRHKYGAKATVVDGIRFASRAEANRYQFLKTLQKCRQISGLKLQVTYPLMINGIRVARYILDFEYTDNQKNCLVHEDVKGFRTPVYKLKKRMFEAQYNAKITEID